MCYNLMGPPSYMRSVVDRNVVMRRMPVNTYQGVGSRTDKACTALAAVCSPPPVTVLVIPSAHSLVNN